MNNLFFIESDDYSLIEIKIKELLQQLSCDINQLITYDMEETNVSNAILDLDTYGFFNEKKIVYCKNASFLTPQKSEIDHDIDMLTKYLNNPNPNNILIISCNKTDGKKNIVKLVKKNCQIIASEVDLNHYVKDYLKSYEIDSDTINYFLINVGNSIDRITNEMDKLKSFLESSKKITKHDIDLIVIKKIDTNIFDLIDAIINKNKKKSLTIYHEMINYGEDVFKIFVSLANQIRLIYQVKVLAGFSNDEIKNQLNLKNPKQVMALRYKIGKYRENDLLGFLEKLAIMDEELKTGKCIDEIAFPIFIASL